MAEIGRLTAVFDADTRKFDSGVKGVESKLGGLKTSFTSVSSGASDFSSALGTVAPRMTSFVGSVAGAAGPLSLFTVGLAASYKASLELHQALLGLVTSTAEWQGSLTDLSQQTGIAVETLSAFEILARQTGGSLDSIVASLGIFQRNLEAATNPTSKQAEALNELGVSTLETEKALRETMAALARMPEGFHQTALAMELFGRGGKQISAILKETHGDLDAAMAEFRAMGLEVSGPTSAAADKLNDKMVILDAQVRALKASLAVMVTPQVSSAVDTLTKLINENKDAINTMSGAVGVLAVYLGVNFVASIQAVNVALAVMQQYLRPTIAALEFIKGLGGVTGDIPVQRNAAAGVVDTTGIDKSAFGAGVFRAKKSGGVGGGGGGGGKRSIDEMAAYKQIVENTSRSLAFFGKTTEHAQVEQDFLRAGIEKLSPQLRAQAEAYKLIALRLADNIDAKKELADHEEEEARKAADLARVTADVTDAVDRQAQAISDLQSGLPGWVRDTLDFIDAKRKEGYAWTVATAQIYLNNEAMKEQLRIQAEGATRARRVFELATGNETRPRFATTARAEEEIARVREQMQDLANDLTSIFDRSITDGFERGIKSGLLTLSQGLLRIVEDVFLRRLAEGLSGLLGGIATGGGGGGFFGGLLKAIFGGIAGGAGGGLAPGAAGKAFNLPMLHFASGGMVPGIDRGYDSVPAMLRPGEIVLPRGAAAAQTVINQYINLPAAPRGSYVSPKSARQQADLVMAALRGAT